MPTISASKSIRGWLAWFALVVQQQAHGIGTVSRRKTVVDGSKREFLITLAVAFPFLFWGMGSISFLEPNEGMYGSVAREMAEGGDWITPHFNHVRYLHKPPLYFWLTSLTVTFLGPSEGVVRLWSALPALGTAILIWHLGRIFYGAHAGLLSAIVLVSSVGVFRYARVAAADFLLVFSITLALYGFVRAVLTIDPPTGRRPIDDSRFTIHELRVTIYALLFWLGMALGVLTKGLIGLVFPLLIVGLYGLVDGDRRAGSGGRWRLFAVYRPLFTVTGILFFLVLVVPWHLLAAWENPGFFDFYFVDNQFLRFLNGRALTGDEIPASTFAFLSLTLVWFFPWSLFLPVALRQGFPDPRSNSPAQRLRLLVGLWTLTVLGFFSLASFKLEHYFLPVIPPLSLMVGGLWSEAVRAKLNPSWGSGLRWCLAVMALGCSLSGAALVWLSDFLNPQAILAGLAELNVYYRILQERGAGLPFASVAPFVELTRLLGAGLMVAMPLAFVFFYLCKPKASFATVLCMAGFIGLLVFKLLLVVEPHHSARAVALSLVERAAPTDPIVHEGPLEYSGSLPFYTGRRIYVLSGRRGSLDFGSFYEDARPFFFDEDRLQRLWDRAQRIFLITRGPSVDGVVTRLPSEKVFLIGQYGSRRLYSNKPIGLISRYAFPAVFC